MFIVSNQNHCACIIDTLARRHTEQFKNAGKSGGISRDVEGQGTSVPATTTGGTTPAPEPQTAGTTVTTNSAIPGVAVPPTALPATA